MPPGPPSTVVDDNDGGAICQRQIRRDGTIMPVICPTGQIVLAEPHRPATAKFRCGLLCMGLFSIFWLGARPASGSWPAIAADRAGRFLPSRSIAGATHAKSCPVARSASSERSRPSISPDEDVWILAEPGIGPRAARTRCLVYRKRESVPPTCPTPRWRPRPRAAVSPTALPQSGYCLPRWRRSRIAATGRAAPAAQILRPRRGGA